MKVIKRNLINGGSSCNFCRRGKLASNTGLKYPYETVIEFTNENYSGLTANICEDCLNELIEKSKLLNSEQEDKRSVATEVDSKENDGKING